MGTHFPVDADVPERARLGRLRAAPVNGKTEPEVMRIGELLILAALWMLFGFMVWYYGSPWHGTPVRLVSAALLDGVLGDDFYRMIANADRAYLFEVQTRIPFTFPDGSREALGFIVLTNYRDKLKR